MTKQKAVDTLMEEWGADEKLRPFFTKVVDNYMGVSSNVFSTDLEVIRSIISSMK